MRRNLWRRFSSTFAMGVVYALTALALVPLGLVLWFTAVKGLPSVTHLEFFINPQRPSGIPGGGVANAIVGTAIVVSLASLAAIPVGVLSGIYLAEYGAGRWASWVRLASDVLVGAPSIALGLFAFALVVVPQHHYSAIAASVALSVLMLPVVIRTTEGAVGLIPHGLRESGLALGLRGGASRCGDLPAAAACNHRGCWPLHALRADGAVLFTALGNQNLVFDPTRAMSTLPLVVFRDALTPYTDLQQEAWGAALLLMVMVLVINLGSRWVLRRQIRLAQQL
jgi:phosphate transport system permease protein